MSPQLAQASPQLQQLLAAHGLTPAIRQLLQAAGVPVAPVQTPPVVRRAAQPARPAAAAVARPAARPAATSPSGAILWPSRAAYLRAMQNGANLHPTLQRGQLQRDSRGFPMVASGSFSSAYRFRFPNGNHVAVRVFHPPPQAADRAKVDVWRARYAKLQKHFDSIRVPAEIVEVRWIDDGIRVDGRSLPVTVMPWVEAQGLDDWVGAKVGRPDGARALADFASNWRRAMRDLRAAKLAHGDLHHGNVLIERQSGAMRFIDYDAMWAPTLAGTANDEIGHPNYQHPSYFHPQTRARQYGPELDRFSALVIYVTAKALEHDPSLWQRFHRADDHLIFTHDDYRNPAASPVFQAVAASPNQTVRKLGAELARACRAPPEQTPELERAIAGAGGAGAAPTGGRPQRPWYQGR